MMRDKARCWILDFSGLSFENLKCLKLLSQRLGCQWPSQWKYWTSVMTGNLIWDLTVTGCQRRHVKWQMGPYESNVLALHLIPKGSINCRTVESMRVVCYKYLWNGDDTTYVTFWSCEMGWLDWFLGAQARK